MKFLFWNINSKPIFKEIAEIAFIENIDVILIAEFPEPKEDMSNQLLEKLNFKENYYISVDKIYDVKINVFCKQCYSDSIIHKGNIARGAVIYIKIPSYEPILLMAFHIQSKVNWDDNDQFAHSCEIKDKITEWEERLNCSHTILCGDFNMNPFDKGVVSHTGINAVMEREIAMKGCRTIEKKPYRYFYNPMWGFLGDLGKGKVSGTMRYNSSIPTSYHWLLFDQVFLRPELIDIFDDQELDIITQIGETNLLTPQKKISTKYSDHLPIKFKLKIEAYEK